MTVIGITGSLASGKSTVAQLIAKKKYSLFNADKVVSALYKNSKFISLIIKKFKLSNKKEIKNQVKLRIIKNKKKLEMLEAIIHPLVRKEMNNFLKIKNKILVLELPLLIESKLNNYFDKIIFVDARKKLRLKRYLKRNNDKKTFEILNKRQLSSIVKKKSCDLIINNNYSMSILKKNIKNFIKNYE
jgi:dephospho-CoA kinase|tara:strand:+ start:166 stop:726 length:561 start_codon:yes stop_codon:yes gene_type:complete